MEARGQRRALQREELTQPARVGRLPAGRNDEAELIRVPRCGVDRAGIHVARLAGVPAPVLERAREILAFLEKQHGPDPGSEAPVTEGPIRRKVKTGRALAGSLFAGLPDPLLMELREVDLSSLTGERRDQALKALNTEHCTCGCGLTLAQCRVDDPTCDVSLPIARDLVKKIASTSK